jgi:DUF1680 family protein
MTRTSRKTGFKPVPRVSRLAALALAITGLPALGADPPLAVKPATQAQLLPLTDVRLLPSPFADAVAANRKYILQHDADRLLFPFLREAGLAPKGEQYPNWESMGLEGHTAGHYLSALSYLIATGQDPDGEAGRRLDYMLAELDRVQKANGNGYIGGISGSREYWEVIGSGDVGRIRDRWAPWYNLHKMFAGLRDAYVIGGRPQARELLAKYGNWCVNLIAKLDEQQMQRMLGNEYGGMNEVMADIYTITGDKKYLEAAERFNHRSIIDPLMNGEDRLTGLHANTQIPKIIGLEEIATLTGNEKEDFGARFFWDTVTKNRSVAFGGNSVSEHFNDPKDFGRMIAHREGPETCNTYNMLRLTEKLFAPKPEARYADYYERALYNHILSTIDPKNPGFVYFTPLRPGHYRVYSTPEESFWCCVGTGIESPGRYGQFIYAKGKDGGVYVNLFIPSVVKVGDGISLEQDNKFPYEPRTALTLKLDQPKKFALRIRHPAWVPEGKMAIRVNGEPVAMDSKPSTYAEIDREWKDGDKIDVDLPMHLTVDPLPDGSNWVAIQYGPIVLAANDGADDQPGLRANPGRMAHVAEGTMIPLDKVPCLLTTVADLPKHIVPDPEAGPLHFRIKDVIHPTNADGIKLEPFFAMHDVRYQMYFELTTAENVREQKEKLAAEERARAAREAATLDSVNPGEQQSEVEHDYKGEGVETGLYNGRRWRHGREIQYTLNAGSQKSAELSVTYSGDDTGRTFDIFANGTLIATQNLTAEKRGSFIEKGYAIPASVLAEAKDGRVTIKFAAKQWLAGGVYDVRLIKPGSPAPDGSSPPTAQP